MFQRRMCLQLAEYLTFILQSLGIPYVALQKQNICSVSVIIAAADGRELNRMFGVS
jgi:hypothetical protein